MPEWWTYSLTDFLLFSPATYWRLFERYNEAIWPLQIGAAALGLALFALLLRRPAVADRAVPLLLAFAWAWVAYAFLYERYATINWAAVYFAAGFAAQAALLLALALGGGLRFEDERGARRAIGLAILAFGIFLQPFVGPLLGRSWSMLELFGLTPDPTVVATLGVLLAARGRARWLAFIIPLIWCAVEGLTLLAMGAPDAILLPAADVLAMAAAAIGA